MNPSGARARAACFVALASCASPRLDDADVERVCGGFAEVPPVERLELAVAFDSPRLRGTYAGVLIVRHEPCAVRLQLFPEIGGKLLDLVATREWQRGHWPGSGDALDHPRAADSSVFLRCFAVALLEGFAPPPAARVEHAWRTGPAEVTLRLRPAFGEDSCTVVVDGAIRQYAIRCAGLPFRMRVDARGARVEARGLTIEATVTSREPVELLPAGAFALELPEDA